ncbi:hypothetical protein [Burkholderia cenocepacia]|uniref:hypothetical protein n=1 Tax=Burkholderia cenocepacia TaxID=95486 RepID=UPI001CF26836|nr:hypothetical protein [Burkholderia cenocepacia]MCA8005170.1 hypothetical protein [Burkholderia cenocepacia]
MQTSFENLSAAALLWTKRRWVLGFAACLMSAALFHPFNWIWPACAVACLIIALHAHERLAAIRGKPCRWRDVFDLEDPLTAWLSKQTSSTREGK